MAVVGAKGLARTTLADVADEAGVSVGLVQSYFRSKAQLLRFGVEYMYARSEARLLALAEEHGPVAAVRAQLALIGETLLPLDEERRRELVVWTEFLPATLADAEMSRLHKETTGRLLGALTGAMEEARRTGELPEDADPRAEAAALVAFVDGLTVHCLVTDGDFTGESSRAALRTYLDRLLRTPGSPPSTAHDTPRGTP